MSVKKRRLTIGDFFAKIPNIVEKVNVPSDCLEEIHKEFTQERTDDNGFKIVPSQDSQVSSIILPAIHERDPANGPQSAKGNITSGPYQPELSVFPLDKRNRKFRKEWYNAYRWLEYSPSANKVFCFWCRAFSDPNKGYTESAFTINGFNNWSKAVQKFKSHESCDSHKNSESCLVNFTESLLSGSICAKLDKQYSKEVDENRKYLKKVCETVVFCARQGIALRGHDEKISSNNRGNFLELMDLRAKDCPLIEKVFKNKEKSYSYVHKDHQNDILNLCKSQIYNYIQNKIKESRYFSVMVDETQDISNHEQVAVVFRYIDNNLEIHESFAGFYRTKKTDGESLYNLLKEVISSFGLNLSDLRAQCYDGAANMRGPYSGVAARMLQDNPMAIYVHCYAHILNLCLVSTCSSIPAVRNAFQQLNALHSFIEASSKRHAIFEKIRLSTNTFYGGSSTLKSLSDTRWSCRVEAIKALFDNFEGVILTLEEISENDALNGGKANALLICMTSFEFLFTLSVLRKVLEQCNSLSKHLQSPDLSFDVVKMLSKATIETLDSFRNDLFFNKVWSYVIELCEKNSYPGPKMKRRNKIPSKLGGGEKNPHDDVKSYYRITILNEIIDSVSNEIQTRFKENDLSILIAINSILSASDVHQDEQHVSTVCNFYNLQKEDLLCELRLFYSMIKSANMQNSNLKNSLNFFREKNLQNTFPLITLLFKFFLTVPMTSASCERSFSCLRRLKTYLRSTMGEERLSSLAVLAIERDIPLNYNDIVTKFSFLPQSGNRRLRLQ